MKSVLALGGLLALVCALWLKRRLAPDPLVEADRAISK